MAKFCKACGTSNEDDAAFCDHCGTALRRPAQTSKEAPQQAISPSPTVPRNHRKWLLITGTVLASAVALGAGSWAWITIKNSPPNASQQRAIAEQWLSSNQDRLLRESCLRNFAYQQKTVRVSSWDKQTIAWMEELVAAQIYTPFGQDYWGRVYEHGPAAEQYIRGSALCLASGIKLEQTELLPVDKDAGDANPLNSTREGRRLALMKIQYTWDGVPEFAKSPRFLSQWPSAMKNTVTEIPLYRGDDGWRTATESDIRRIEAEYESKTRQPKVSDVKGSFGTWLSNIFSFGGSAPEKIAREFFDALLAGKFDRAIELIHPQQRSKFGDEKIKFLLMPIQNKWPKQISSSIKIETKVNEIQGDWASVNVKLIVDKPDLSPHEHEVDLRKHEGKWYIVLE